MKTRSVGVHKPRVIVVMIIMDSGFCRQWSLSHPRETMVQGQSGCVQQAQAHAFMYPHSEAYSHRPVTELAGLYLNKSTSSLTTLCNFRLLHSPSSKG